ncbi:MAG TPA: carboxypeptidase-like regulatory domain-containing protein [Blastocatellia bacterium]|nr:carboxypeptidase-like regulatory domain-containing protein [Blastocatellia bacterium]
MRKAVSYFIVGCLISAWFMAPATSNPAEASTTLALISGTVKDDAGKPLGGALVALFTAQPGQVIGGSLLKSLTTDAEGRFKVNVAPGMYKLRAAADGFRPTFTLITLDAANKLTHNFALRRVGTVVENRGDKGDYRWIGRSVPRSVLHYQEDEDYAGGNTVAEDTATKTPSSLHGVVQFTSINAGDVNFTGANFAISSSFGNNLEFALLGQGGLGEAAPQRIAAIASLRPHVNHQVTAMAGYGQAMVRERKQLRTLDQFSFAAMDAWQVSKPLLLILGFDYSTFTSSMGKGRDSILPRFAVQYTPTARTHINAALTPGANSWRQTPEGLDTENLQTRFEAQPAEVATTNGTSSGTPLADRSRRLEIGFEQIFGEENDSSLEAAAFFDTISGHGVGVLALPLEASPETQNALQEVARQVVAMNGAARGMRVMYAKRFNDYLSASVGYSFGRGERLNEASLNQITPARMFTGTNFQVASAKLDFDLTRRTGTRVSTVVRLSPSAVVFAIDPFAGRMSVYDPNVSIYVTQALPTFGLPVKCQALVDVRNLLNQTVGVESETAQLIAARSQRSVRGAISFQW